jgi:anti-sigma factor RsiW
MGMNGCRDIREKLSAFIDHELPHLERNLIEKHLLQCPACRQEEISLRRINDLLDSMPDERPAPTFPLKTVHRAASWMQCNYVKEHLFRPAVAYVLSAVSLVFYFEAGALRKRAYPAYRHLRNFDDFPPESLSSIYIGLIQEEYK